MTRYPGARDFPTNKILECISPAEYQALTDVKKDYLKMILSCGTIYFTIGSSMRDVILDTMFPVGTTTHTNILAMLEWPDNPTP